MKAISECTLDELFVKLLALTIGEGELVFYGGASPLAACAVMLAKRTHAPHLVHIGGNPGGLDPQPPFLPTTAHDWTMLQGSVATLSIDYVFDLATRGDLDRLFLSGAQIDRYGNTNVTAIGGLEAMKVKLPGGGGGAYLSCTAKHTTLWTTRHRARAIGRGKLFTLVEAVDFVTAVGHRTPQGSREELGLKGEGPQWLITNLGVFDFHPRTKLARLRRLYPDVTLEEVLANTGFAPALYDPIGYVELPTAEEVTFIRALDPLEVRKREFPAEELERTFPVAERVAAL